MTSISEHLFRLAQNGRLREAPAAVKAYRNDETTPPEDVWLYKIIELDLAKQVPPDPLAWFRRKQKGVPTI